MTTNFSQTAAYIWSLADLLRGDLIRLEEAGELENVLVDSINRPLSAWGETFELRDGASG